MNRVSNTQLQAAKAIAPSVYAGDFPEAQCGRRHILVKCCFHEDRHPSLSIDTEIGCFKCFACGESGGDVIAYLQKRTGKGFVEIVESLAGSAIAVPYKPAQQKTVTVNQYRKQAIERVWAESKELTSESSI